MTPQSRIAAAALTPCRIAAALCIALAAPAIAQRPIALHLDPAATHINWTLGCNVHTVHGTFKLKSGDVAVDPATGNASGSIVIDATSGESAEPARDKRMHAVILESEKFPTITLHPTHISTTPGLAPGDIPVSGVFNLHGQDHPVQITVAIHPQGPDLALSTHFVVPYVAWGVKDPSVLLARCEKQVTIDVDAVATPSR